jgi:dinuclear metal center YbgI/SA1388 family protein
MKIKDITRYLESLAPSVYQESYDNSGLIVGNPNEEVTGIVICLDSIEAVIDEAIEKKCNMVIAHHPIVFRGLKRFNGRNYIERTVIKAIKHDIAIYAIHTNLDNVRMGVNAKIAEKIGLQNTRILAPKNNLQKLSILLPIDQVDAVKVTLFQAGAGQADSSDKSSYTSVGAMTSGNTHYSKARLELLFPIDKKSAILSALASTMKGHHYSYDTSDINVKDKLVGAGMIGELPKAMKADKFLKHLKTSMDVSCVKYTRLLGKDIKKVALCGGSGGFLLNTAVDKNADIFITADYKYHEFFDADGRIVIADVGHYESEQFTIDLLFDILKDKFSTFVILKTGINTNPVNYL